MVEIEATVTILLNGGLLVEIEAAFTVLLNGGWLVEIEETCTILITPIGFRSLFRIPLHQRRHNENLPVESSPQLKELVLYFVQTLRRPLHFNGSLNEPLD